MLHPNLAIPRPFLSTATLIIFGSMLLGSWFGPDLESATKIFVSPSGRDTQDGTIDQPVATLEKALQLRRAQKRQTPALEPATIYLREGIYRLTKTVQLTREDSGTQTAPLRFSAWQNEAVVLSGAQSLENFVGVKDAALLERLPASARSQVVQCHLLELGIQDFGEAVSAGNRLELFYNHEPMTLARWPNEGFVRMMEVTGDQPLTVHGLQGNKAGLFTYEDDRPASWKHEPEIWLHGYWFWDWSDAWQRVEKVMPTSRTIKLAEPYHHYGYRAGQRYYAANLLCELDRPGEWYLDRESGHLYFWPPAALTNAVVEISVLDTLLSLRDVDWVSWQGIGFECTRRQAISIQGGSHNRVRGGVIRNTGSWAVLVEGGSAHRVEHCHIYGTGEGGVRLSGGDRATLTPAGHEATDNHIHHFGRLQRTYRPAISLSGVGQRAAHNHIHDGPHNAIQLGGNDHIIEYNEIHDVCFETGDVGAFYTGRDWTARGTVIQFNYFHDIQGPGLHGAMAVYLDDSASGFTIFGNLFVRAGRAAFIGGGRDNRVENNIFVDCHPAVHVDARGLGWMRDHVDPGGTLPTRLAAVPYQRPPWSERYPQLLNLLEDDPGAPKGNVITRNISVGGEWSSIEKKAEPLVIMKDNLIQVDPGFVQASSGDYRLRDDSVAWKIGFKPLPLEKIGPRNVPSSPAQPASSTPNKTHGEK